MSKPLLYPARQRCRGCRNFFGPIVVKGQYCSYDCAGEPDPWRMPFAQWPRKHLRKPNSWPVKPKVCYACEADARAACSGEQTAYECDFCWMWHVGTIRKAEA